MFIIIGINTNLSSIVLSLMILYFSFCFLKSEWLQTRAFQPSNSRLKAAKIMDHYHLAAKLSICVLLYVMIRISIKCNFLAAF